MPAHASGPLIDNPANRNFEWLAICPAAWRDSVKVLRDFRATPVGGGLVSGIWTLEQVDSTYGSHDAEHIRQALQEAQASWTTKPKYVVLVGDAYVTGGAQNIIDDWKQYNPELGRWEDYTRGLWLYMELTDDGVLDVPVGRLPASSAGDVGAFVAKVKRHDSESDPTYGDRSLLLVQDTATGGNDPNWARTLADSLYAGTMFNGPRQSIHMSALSCCYPEWEAAALAGWNAGPGTVIAMGTGSGWWQLVHFFDTCPLTGYWTINKLAATNKFPVLFGLSCGIGGIDQPWNCSLRHPAEQLLMSRRDRGACLIVAPTRNTYQWSNFNIGRQILSYRSVAGTWGKAYMWGLQSVASDPSQLDHAFEYVLLGDPATRIFGAPSGGDPGEEEPPIIRGVVEIFPNPAIDVASIRYTLSRKSAVRIEVINVAGRLATVLAEREESPGSYVVSWKGNGDDGKRLPAGVYFVRLQVNGNQKVQRIVLL